MPRVSTFSRANAVHNPKVVELDSILDAIKNGKWEARITELRKLEGAAFQEKKKLLPGFTATGVFDVRNDAGLTELSGFAQCDVDFKDNPGKKFSELRQIVIDCPHVYAAFRSPSGRGIKALVKCKPDKELHAGSHTAMVQYLADRGVKVDDRVCALSQLCFVSHDPNLYLNKSAKTIAPVPVDKNVEATLVEFEETRTDEEIIAACEDAWPEVFQDLWAGEAGEDHSSADHQLIAILRENCFSNDRVVELFEQSGLYRAEKYKDRTHAYVMRSLVKCSAVKALSLLEPIPEDPADPSPPRKKKVKGAWGWTTAFEIPEWKAEDDNYIVKRVIYGGTVTCIYGAPGSGKTFCIFSMAVAVASNTEWQGHKVRQGAVLYFGLEGHHGIRKRIQALKKEGHLTDEGAKYFAQIECRKDSLDLLSEDHVKKVAETAAAFESECGLKVSLVIIDTLARATPGGDENSTKDMGVAVVNSQGIANMTGAAVCIVHHSNKLGVIRGSTALPAAFDSVYEVLRHETDESVREFKTKKQRDEDDAASVYFRLKPIELGIDLDNEPVTSCILEFLKDHEIPVKKEKGGPVDLVQFIPDDGASLEDLVVSTGIARSTLQRRLKAMVSAMELRRDIAGNYYKIFEDFDPTQDL